MRASLEVCVAMCACCPRCRYVSYSAVNHDCSWHHECDMRALSTLPGNAEAHGSSYTTIAVAKSGAMADGRKPRNRVDELNARVAAPVSHVWGEEVLAT